MTNFEYFVIVGIILVIGAIVDLQLSITRRLDDINKSLKRFDEIKKLLKGRR